MHFLADSWSAFLERDLRFQLIVFFAVTLLVVSIVLFSVVIRLRKRKSRAERKAKKLISKIEPVLLDLIYEEHKPSSWKKSIRGLRNELNFSMYEFHSYARFSDYLVELHKQLEGDSAKRIEKIYRDLSLPEMTLELLKNGKWHQKVKALSALSEFQVKKYLFEIIQFMDHKQRLVRDEAQFAAIVLGGKRATQSIDELTHEISKWQQLRLIEQCVIIGDDIKPDVMSWLSSANDSLIELALRLCIRMGWYEVIVSVPELITHKREEIRRLSVQAIGELGSSDLLPDLLHRFEVESKPVQMQSLLAIAELDVDQTMKDFLRGQLMYGTIEIALASAQALLDICGQEYLESLSEKLNEQRKVLIKQVLYGAV